MSLAEANRKYFDNITNNYDNKPWAQKMNAQVTEAIRSRLDWIGINWVSSENDAKEVRLLDYACGTGLISRALGPYVTQTTGIDISPNMVSTYNSRATAAGLPSSTISAVTGDIFTPESDNTLREPKFFDFDIAAVGFGYHHFDDVLLCTKRLKERLKDGGILMIADFLQGGDSNDNFTHKHSHTHSHHHHHHDHHHEASDTNSQSQGDSHTHEINQLAQMNDSIKVFSFDESGVRQFFEEAGFVDVDISVMEEKVYMEFGGNPMTRTVFFAKGRKPRAKKEGVL